MNGTIETFALNENVDFQKMNLKSMSIHHNIYRSKIHYESPDGLKNKIQFILKKKNLEDVKQNLQITNHYIECKIPLEKEEEINILHLEKKNLKMMANKLVKSKCLEEIRHALDYFHSSILYINEKPYFVCKFDRSHPDIQQIIQEMCLESPSSDKYDIFFIPQEIRFKPSKSIYIEYTYKIERNTEKKTKTKTKKEKENENEYENEIECEGKNKDEDDQNNKSSEKGEGEEKEEKEEKILNEENNVDDNILPEVNFDNVENKEVSNKDFKNVMDDENKDIGDLEEEHKKIVSLTKQALHSIEKKKKEIKKSFSKYIQNMGNKITFDAKFEDNVHSTKQKERRSLYDHRYIEEKNNLLSLIENK